MCQTTLNQANNVESTSLKLIIFHVISLRDVDLTSLQRHVESFCRFAKVKKNTAVFCKHIYVGNTPVLMPSLTSVPYDRPLFMSYHNKKRGP